MSTFKYNTRPMTTGNFTARAVLGAEINPAVLDAAVAAATGVAADKCPLVLKAYLNQFLLCAQGCAWANEIYGMLRVRPTAGGSKASPNDFHNAVEINADVALSYTSEAINTWRSALALERVEEVGFVTPIIDNIISTENGALDHYVPGTVISVQGDNLKFKKSEVTQGIFFSPAAGPEVRATVYAKITDLEVLVVVPTTLSGPLTVRAAVAVNGVNVRSFTYSSTIS